MSKQRQGSTEFGRVSRTSGSGGTRYFFERKADGKAYSAARPTELRKSLLRKGVGDDETAAVVAECRKLADAAKAARSDNRS